MRKFRNKQLIEIVEDLGEKGVLVQNEGEDSDRWIIPRNVFDATYEEVGETKCD